MITKAVKHAIRIRCISRSSKRDKRTYGRRLALQWKFVEQALVYVGVKGWIVLEKIFSCALDVDHFRTLHLQTDAHVHGNHGTHVNVLRKGSKPWSGNLEVIGVEWNVWNDKFSRPIRTRGALETAHGIMQVNRGVGHNGTRGI